MRDERIVLEIKRLQKIYKNIAKDKKSLIDDLISRCAFMKITLEDLEKQINNEGAVELFKQGAQKMLREHPAAKIYNTTIKNYSGLFKQLTELLPPSLETDKKDDLSEFLLKGREKK